MDKIVLYLDTDVAADLKNILSREAEFYTYVEDHLPQRIKNIRLVVNQLDVQIRAND